LRSLFIQARGAPKKQVTEHCLDRQAKTTGHRLAEPCCRAIRTPAKQFAECYKAARLKPTRVIRNEELWDDHEWFLAETKAGRLSGADFRRVLGQHFFKGG